MMEVKEIAFWKEGSDKKTLNATLFSTSANELARDFSKSEKKRNKPTQLRRFYDEVQRLQSKLQSTSERPNADQEFENGLAYLHMLIAKAAYAQGRELVTPKFVDFLKHSIQQVESRDDLRVFADFFEAVMAFYKVHRPSDKG